MRTFFSDPERPVCVAVAFDDNAPHLIEVARSYASRTGSKLLLVRVTEPWVGAAGMGILPVPEISDKVQQELISKAQHQLELLATQVKGVETIVEVKLGVVSDEVIAAAQHYRAKMIFVGHVSREPTFIPLGFSSALGIMGNAPVPVMVISDTQPVDSGKTDLLVMVADDLSNNGGIVLAGGYAFAASIGARLEHLHANSITKESLQAALTMATSAAKAGADGGVSAEDYFSILHETLGRRMAKRLSTVEEEWDPKPVVHISHRIVDGHPDEAIAEAVGEGKYTVLTFGRHHTFHRKPFLIGKVPFRAMLKMTCPGVLIIPPTFESAN